MAQRKKRRSKRGKSRVAAYAAPGETRISLTKYESTRRRCKNATKAGLGKDARAGQVDRVYGDRSLQRELLDMRNEARLTKKRAAEDAGPRQRVTIVREDGAYRPAVAHWSGARDSQTGEKVEIIDRVKLPLPCKSRKGADRLMAQLGRETAKAPLESGKEAPLPKRRQGKIRGFQAHTRMGPNGLKKII